MTHRYFVEERLDASRVTLEGTEAHHLLHVMRAQAGDEITLFDGSGREAVACVERTARSSVEIAVQQIEHVNRELPVEITIGVALPKGDRQKWLVEKAVEVGVASLVPLTTARSVAQPTGKAIQRLRRQVIEASKQCGRNRLMSISEPQAFHEWIAQETSGRAFILHPGGTSLAACCDGGHARGQWLACIGPEGGFTSEEIDAASAAQWLVAHLGERILRIETAAIATAVVLSAFASS